MLKLPEIKVGIVAVSRDCFPVTLSKERKERVVKEYGKGLYNCSVVVENEKDVLAALEELKRAEVNALVVYLGNFGPEAPPLRKRAKKTSCRAGATPTAACSTRVTISISAGSAPTYPNIPSAPRRKSPR